MRCDSDSCHFVDGPAEAQRGYVTCPRSHSYRQTSLCLRLTQLKKDCGNKRGFSLYRDWKAQIISPRSVQGKQGPDLAGVIIWPLEMVHLAVTSVFLLTHHALVPGSLGSGRMDAGFPRRTVLQGRGKGCAHQPESRLLDAACCRFAPSFCSLHCPGYSASSSQVKPLPI